MPNEQTQTEQQAAAPPETLLTRRWIPVWRLVPASIHPLGEKEIEILKCPWPIGESTTQVMVRMMALGGLGTPYTVTQLKEGAAKFGEAFDAEAVLDVVLTMLKDRESFSEEDLLRLYKLPPARVIK